MTLAAALALVLTSTAPVDPIAIEYRTLWIRAEEREGKVKAELGRCEEGLRLARAPATGGAHAGIGLPVPTEHGPATVGTGEGLEPYLVGGAIGAGVTAVLALIFLR